jgi:HSP20 family protein
MTKRDIIPVRSGTFSGLPASRRISNPFLALQQEFDRIFGDFFGEETWTSIPQGEEFFPNVNVTELQGEIEVTAELPGLDENDIEISVSRDTLTLKGEKKLEHEEQEGSYYRMERSFGSFCRTIPLPADSVDVDDVSAEYKNGVLTITIPKKEDEQHVSRRIEVKTS